MGAEFETACRGGSAQAGAVSTQVGVGTCPVGRSPELGVRRHVVLADAGYGDARDFREGLRARGLHYLVGVAGMHTVWPPGAQPQQPPKVQGRAGRPRTRWVAQGATPWSLVHLAKQLPEEEWRQVQWREGVRGQQASRFAAVRVRSAARHMHGMVPGEDEWLLVEWP